MIFFLVRAAVNERAASAYRNRPEVLLAKRSLSPPQGRQRKVKTSMHSKRSLVKVLTEVFLSGTFFRLYRYIKIRSNSYQVLNLGRTQ